MPSSRGTEGRCRRPWSSSPQLPGVGRKTANVVRSVAFALPGLPVDTHVGRIVRRLGLTTQSDPVKVESEICALLPPEDWGAFSLRLILHGRAVCLARRPRCQECLLAGPLPLGRDADPPPGPGLQARRGGRPRRPPRLQGPGPGARKSDVVQMLSAAAGKIGPPRAVLGETGTGSRHLVPRRARPGSAARRARTTAPFGAPSSRPPPGASWRCAGSRLRAGRRVEAGGAYISQASRVVSGGSNRVAPGFSLTRAPSAHRAM